MAKFSIHDLTASELSVCMAALAAGTGAIAGSVPFTPNDDDDAGPANAAAPAVDSTGLPWDERIHASSKALNSDGSWRSRRKIDATLIAAVEAELRARSAAPVYTPMAPPPGAVGSMSPPMPMPPPVPQYAPPMPPSEPPAPPVTFVPPPPIVVPPQPPVPVAPPAPPAGPMDFAGFMNVIGQLLATGTIDAGYLANLTARINAAAQTTFGAITDLDKRPDLLEWVVQIMRQDGKPC